MIGNMSKIDNQILSILFHKKHYQPLQEFYDVISVLGNKNIKKGNLECLLKNNPKISINWNNNSGIDCEFIQNSFDGMVISNNNPMNKIVCKMFHTLIIR